MLHIYWRFHIFYLLLKFVDLSFYYLRSLLNFKLILWPEMYLLIFWCYFWNNYWKLYFLYEIVYVPLIVSIFLPWRMNFLLFDWIANIILSIFAVSCSRCMQILRCIFMHTCRIFNNVARHFSYLHESKVGIFTLLTYFCLRNGRCHEPNFHIPFILWQSVKFWRF